MSAAASNSANGAMLSPRATQIEVGSGRYVDVYRPDPATLSEPDIARALSFTCRYGGHVKRFYSVAEHALLVYDLLRWQGADDRLLLAALFHDAAEAYLGDVPSPLKYALRLEERDRRLSVHGHAGSAYDDLTDRMEAAIAERFAVSVEDMNCPALKLADMWALKVEAAALTFSGGAEWRWPGELPNGGELPAAVSWKGGLSAKEAYARWLVDVGLVRVRMRSLPAPLPSEGTER